MPDLLELFVSAYKKQIAILQFYESIGFYFDQYVEFWIVDTTSFSFTLGQEPPL